MTWSIQDPGLPPLPDGHTPKPKYNPETHRAAARWIAKRFGGSVTRGRAARRRWDAVGDDLLMARGRISGGRSGAPPTTCRTAPRSRSGRGRS